MQTPPERPVAPWARFWEALWRADVDLRARRIAEGRDPETGEPCPNNFRR